MNEIKIERWVGTRVEDYLNKDARLFMLVKPLTSGLVSRMAAKISYLAPLSLVSTRLCLGPKVRNVTLAA